MGNAFIFANPAHSGLLELRTTHGQIISSLVYDSHSPTGEQLARARLIGEAEAMGYRLVVAPPLRPGASEP